MVVVAREEMDQEGGFCWASFCRRQCLKTWWTGMKMVKNSMNMVFRWSLGSVSKVMYFYKGSSTTKTLARKTSMQNLIYR